MSSELALALGSIGACFILAYIGSKAKDELGLLQVLLSFGSLILLVNAGGMLSVLSFVDVSEPSLAVSGSDVWVVHSNSTGSVIVTNSTGGNWTSYAIYNSTLTGGISPSTFTGLQVSVLVWILYIALAYYVVSYLYRVLMWTLKKSRRSPT